MTPRLTDDPADAPAATPRRTSRELIASGLYSFADKGAALVFGFGTLCMLARFLPKAQLGVGMFFTGVVATLEVARAGLIQNGMIRFLTSEPEAEHPGIHGGAALLNGGVAALGAALLWFGGEALEQLFHYPGVAELTRIYAVTFLATTPLWQLNYVQQAHLEFRGAFWATIIRYSALFAVTVAAFVGLVAVDADEMQLLRYLAWAQLAAASLGALVSYRYARPYLPAAWRFSRAWAGRLLGFGRYVFGTNLSSMLYKQVDQAMLGALLMGPVPGAVYGLAMRITNFVDVPTLAVASVVFPESSRASVSDGPAAQARMYERAVAAILACVVPALLVVAILPGFIVQVVGGEAYAETIPVLQLTVLYSLFIPFANQFGTLLDASGRPQLNFAFTAAGMALNVLMNYVFISRLGIIGAPLGTLTTYVLTFAAMQTLLHRRYGVRLGRVFAEVPGMYARLFRVASAKIRPALG